MTISTAHYGWKSLLFTSLADPTDLYCMALGILFRWFMDLSHGKADMGHVNVFVFILHLFTDLTVP